MEVFPTLSSGSALMYPTTVAKSYVTRVVKFLSGSEQRWSVRPQHLAFEIQYSHLNSRDLGVILRFFTRMRGAYVDASFDNTFSLTYVEVDGSTKTFEYLQFETDEIEWTEPVVGQYSLTLRFKQVRR